MKLNKLTLNNFKNFEHFEAEFHPQVNAFTGNNGVGKTNLLDAIYTLAMGKSYFGLTNRQLIRHGQNFFSIKGRFNRDNDSFDILLKYREGEKKSLSVNGKEYPRLSDYIGLVPVVMISPYDRDLISESGETRRRFTDRLIAQYDKDYLNNLIRYTRSLRQRNSLLKYFAANGSFDPDRLDAFDRPLARYAEAIHAKRQQFVQSLAPILSEKYARIAGSGEQPGITYRSALNQTAAYELLQKNLERDRLLQYTSDGIHRDDLIFTLNGHPIKKFGSQGQQKSFLIALRLAEADMLFSRKNDAPILLFDDIFDKLDPGRVRQILDYVKHRRFGQVFITDTHPERVSLLLDALDRQARIFEL